MKKFIIETFKNLLIIVLAHSFVYLQAQNNELDPSHAMKEITLDEVVISSNKLEEPVSKVSQPVRIITSKSINQVAAPTTADLLSSSTGISVQKSQQGGGSPNIRGFEANRILLVIDGVRMNNLIYRSGHLQNIITIDPAILDKVEVLFGPSSTMYGSDALGGSIHMITKDPQLSVDPAKQLFRLNAYTRYASANQGIGTHIDFNIGMKKFGSFSSITYNKFGDLRMGGNKNPFDNYRWERPYYIKRIDNHDSMMVNDDPLIQKYSGYHQTDLLQKFIFRPNERIQHRINLQFSTSTDIPRYDRLTEMSSGKLKYADWYYGPQLRSMAAYDITIKEIAGFDQMHAGISAQYLEESRHSRKTNAAYLTHRTEYVSVFGGFVDLYKKWNHHDLHLGAEIQGNNLNSAACDENVNTGTNRAVTTRYPDGKNTMYFYDLYLAHRMDLGQKLSFNQGVRIGYSTLYSTFENMDLFPYPFTEMKQNTPTYSGNIGLVYLPVTNWKLALNLSTGYRVPNIDDLAKIFERPANTVIMPNADLKPEQTLNADFGLVKTWNSGLKWETNLFGTLYQDIIVVSPSTFNGQDSILFDGTMCKVLSGQNKNNAYLYGFSSVVTGNIGKSFTLDAGIYYIYGRVKEDAGERPLNNITPVSGKIGTGYQYKNLTTNFFILFNGWKLMKDYYLNSEDNEQYATPKGMPAWFTLNLRVDYKISRIFSAQLGIDNILDTQYRVFASGINAPGRNIIGTLRFLL